MTNSTDISTSSRATVVALTAGPLVTLAGMALTPWESESTTASYQAALAAHPNQAQWAAITLVAGYALMALASLAVLRRSERAPRPLVIAASIAAFLGATVLPGLVSIDFYDLALAQQLPVGQAVAVADQVDGAPLAGVIRACAGIGFVLGSLLVLTTAWRAKLVGGWAPLLMLAGLIVPGLLLTGPGAGIIVGSALTVVAYAGVARGVTGARRPARTVTAAEAAQPATVTAIAA